MQVLFICYCASIDFVAQINICWLQCYLAPGQKLQLPTTPHGKVWTVQETKFFFYWSNKIQTTDGEITCNQSFFLYSLPCCIDYHVCPQPYPVYCQPFLIQILLCHDRLYGIISLCLPLSPSNFPIGVTYSSSSQSVKRYPLCTSVHKCSDILFKLSFSV